MERTQQKFRNILRKTEVSGMVPGTAARRETHPPSSCLFQTKQKTASEGILIFERARPAPRDDFEVKSPPGLSVSRPMSDVLLERGDRKRESEPYQNI
jgi:hypothetical protein